MNKEEIMLKSILNQIISNKFYLTTILMLLLPDEQVEEVIDDLDNRANKTYELILKELESNEIRTDKTNEPKI